jgi:hypothetical protein
VKKVYAKVRKTYEQASVSKRIEALFLDNIGRVITRDQIQEAARNPKTGRIPENWHQRLSELRTDKGYTILSWRDSKELKMSEYLMPSVDRRDTADKRTRPTRQTWRQVLERAGDACEWTDAGMRCGLATGAIDPIGGGTVRLTPDHRRPHSVNPAADPSDTDAWQALCGRHQVMKKNYWDDSTGWLNVYAIIQSASAAEKERALRFLLTYFGIEYVVQTATSEEKSVLLSVLLSSESNSA